MPVIGTIGIRAHVDADMIASDIDANRRPIPDAGPKAIVIKSLAIGARVTVDPGISVNVAGLTRRAINRTIEVAPFAMVAMEAEIVIPGVRGSGSGQGNCKGGNNDRKRTSHFISPALGRAGPLLLRILTTTGLCRLQSADRMNGSSCN